MSKDNILKKLNDLGYTLREYSDNSVIYYDISNLGECSLQDLKERNFEYGQVGVLSTGYIYYVLLDNNYNEIVEGSLEDIIEYIENLTLEDKEIHDSRLKNQ